MDNLHFRSLIMHKLINYAMTFSIHGQISSRQKIELDMLRAYEIKSRCSAYSPTFLEYVTKKLLFSRKYWGKYGPLLLFGVKVNKSVSFKYFIARFLQHVRMYNFHTHRKCQVVNPTRSWVIGIYVCKALNDLAK